MSRALRAEQRIEEILRSRHQVTLMFLKFAHHEATGSVLLLIATIVALVWANSPWARSYIGLLHLEVVLRVGPYELALSMHQLINDGLMAIFFLVVGLEIKREIRVGELSSARKAILPVTAAVGGMLIPALIYLALNAGKEGMNGWGVPMATDIAFALGILALLGSRVPPTLKIILTALAIADDIGAVLVIALFYTAEIHWPALAVAALLLLLIFVVGRSGIRRVEITFLLAVGVWLAILLSGVHATVAGILVALTVPCGARMDPQKFLTLGYAKLELLEGSELTAHSMVHDEEQFETIVELHEAARDMRPPGLVLEEYLHPVLVWLVLPLFALFNAGVRFDAGFVQSLTHPVALGIILGLVLGKQIAVTLFSWLAVRSGRADLPEGVTWRQIYGVSWLAGIGFTMSLFITDLAFSDPALIHVAKAGILVASLIAGTGGYFLLRWWLPPEEPDLPIATIA